MARLCSINHIFCIYYHNIYIYIYHGLVFKYAITSLIMKPSKQVVMIVLLHPIPSALLALGCKCALNCELENHQDQEFGQ